MRQIDLTNALIDTLREIARTSPTKRKFTPKFLAQLIPGACHTSIGHVESEVRRVLLAEGIAIKYVRLNNSRYFEFTD